MNILGLNFYFHDSTACIVIDGMLVNAIEEERLTRVKHTSSFPEKAIERCLKIAGLQAHDIDHVAVSIKPYHKMGAKTRYLLKSLSNLKPFLKHELLGTYFKMRGFWDWFNKSWPESGKRPEIHFIEHHLAHIEGSFFISPYDKAALLSLDGSGEWATSYMGYGEGNTVECYKQDYFPMSLGSFYEAATEFCGFRPNYDEGKTMGLAPFGDPEVYYPIVDKIVTVDGAGNLSIDLSYFSYQFWGYQRCSQKFYKTFGSPRKRNDDFAENHKNVAAAFQKVLEDRVLKLCDILIKKTKAEYLLLAGGVALNSVMNGRILQEGIFKDLYVMPAAGDNGTAIGAAYCLYNKILNKKRSYTHSNPYLGTEYSNDEISLIISSSKLSAIYHEDITSVTAGLLNEGKIVGWFQGRMEIGPRALGNRSILADPTLPGMKDKINAEVKHREAFRPFAPSAPDEVAAEYFDLKVKAPFMLKVCNVFRGKQELLPAITHVDGSARLQTVNRDVNPLYHELLMKFGELSGTPVLLNTSFNIQGEPIIESPLDAIRCFYSTGLDVLVLGNYVISK